MLLNWGILFFGKYMKIKIITSVVGEGIRLKPKQIMEVPDETGNLYIRNKWAVKIDEPVIELASLPLPTMETAVLKRKKKSKE